MKELSRALRAAALSHWQSELHLGNKPIFQGNFSDLVFQGNFRYASFGKGILNQIKMAHVAKLPAPDMDGWIYGYRTIFIASARSLPNGDKAWPTSGTVGPVENASRDEREVCAPGLHIWPTIDQAENWKSGGTIIHVRSKRDDCVMGLGSDGKFRSCGVVEVLGVVK